MRVRLARLGPPGSGFYEVLDPDGRVIGEVWHVVYRNARFWRCCTWPGPLYGPPRATRREAVAWITRQER